jgi:hypothetical protein
MMARALEIATWSYLAAVLVRFYRRTRLREYVLRYHTYWLSGVIAYPPSLLLGGLLYVTRTAIPPDLYEAGVFLAGGIWLGLLLIGRALRRRRASQMREEASANIALWWRLQVVDRKDILLLQFPAST